MKPIKVWAPLVSTVEIQIPHSDGHIVEKLTCDDNGWWSCAREIPHGEDYMFLVDGEGPYPDPKSPWQPEGIHLTSRRYDHSQFHWQNSQWTVTPLQDAVIYELHIGTFTEEGTFTAAIEKFDYLIDLGVTHIEIMPVAAFPGKHGWGYDGVQLFAPHHHYGTPDELKQFVDACHGAGLAVIMDVVYNHLGPDGNYLSVFGPYFTSMYNTPWGQAVNFDDAYSDEVREFFIDNALMWLRDYHIDGLRLDAVHAIFDRSPKHFLQSLSEAVNQLSKELQRPLVLIAESDKNDPKLMQLKNAGGYDLDCQWSDDLHHSLHAYFTGERNGYYEDFGRLAHIAKSLQQAYAYDGNYSSFRKRRHGAKPEGLEGHHFLGYSQTHDQVGNRACGERIGHLVNLDQLKIISALVFVSPFIPMIFQGEEWAASTPFLYFTDHTSDELATAVSHGRRNEFKAFGWEPEEVPDPQEPSTFNRSCLRWEEANKEEYREILQWYRALSRLRKENPDLGCAPLEQTKITYDEEELWLKIERGAITAHFNLST